MSERLETAFELSDLARAARHLVTMKRSGGRQRDLEDLRELEAARDSENG